MDLTELGLNNSEAKVFEALLRFGKASASDVSRESGVSDRKVYSILESLEVKGLVKVIPEKVKIFVPSDPKSLKKIIRRKVESLKELDKKVDSLRKLYTDREVNPVEVGQGTRSFQKMEEELQKPKKILYNISYHVDCTPDVVRDLKYYKNRKVEVKRLVRYDNETKNRVKKLLKVQSDVKQYPNKGVSLVIRDNDVMRVTLMNSNTWFLVRDKSFIKLMKQLFLDAYEKAKPIQDQ